MRRHQRDSRNGRERRTNSREAVHPARQQYAARGAGFAHTLHRRSEMLIDTVMLEGLGVDIGQEGPYVAEQPRHITAIPFVPLDRQAMKSLDVSKEMDAFRQDMLGYCAEVDKRKKKHFVGEIVEIIPIGGRKLVAEVEAPAVGISRRGLKQILHMAGVAVPLIYAPHLLLGQADTFADFYAMRDVAEATLLGTKITFDPVDVYTDTYTDTVRPERVLTVAQLQAASKTP